MRPQADTLLVRYWAGARAAAGVTEEQVPLAADATVGDVAAAIADRHPDLEPILEVASLLLDGQAARAEQPVGTASTLEVLPPFAGG